MGTPIQIALIIDVVKQVIGHPDTPVINNHLDVLKGCQAEFEKSRQEANAFVLHNPENAEK